MKFKSWFILNDWAKFGFEQRPLKGKILGPEDENPIINLDVEYVTNELRKLKLGIKEGTEKFFGEIIWGDDNPGDIKLTFSPYRGLHATIRKRTSDLTGKPTWICHQVMEIGNKFDKKADTLIADLWQRIQIQQVSRWCSR